MDDSQLLKKPNSGDGECKWKMKDLIYAAATLRLEVGPG